MSEPALGVSNEGWVGGSGRFDSTVTVYRFGHRLLGRRGRGVHLRTARSLEDQRMDKKAKTPKKPKQIKKKDAGAAKTQ
ncbi:MAG TPA: hypothetical protein VLR93_01480 [Patescibacteria group bacterium]|nr:hypothetical protein [Patescibacteria group bacterium]